MMTSSTQTVLSDKNAMEAPGFIAIDSQIRPPQSEGRDEEKAEVEIKERPAATPGLLTWNKPIINMWRFFVTLLCFINMGLNDAAYGVWTPTLQGI